MAFITKPIHGSEPIKTAIVSTPGEKLTHLHVARGGYVCSHPLDFADYKHVECQSCLYSNSASLLTVIVTLIRQHTRKLHV